MKKIIILIISILVVSCNLEEDLLTNPSLNGLTTEDDVKALLTGAYAGLLGSSNPGYYGRNYLYLREVPTDNILGTGARRDLDIFTLGTSHTSVVNTYNDIYAMILKTNLLIDNVDDAKIDEDLINWYKSQAQFLQALGYSDLTSLFGDVVLITSSINDIEDKPSRSSVEEVEQYILTLLDEAIPFLNKEGSEDLPGAATLGAGYALKMKLHLKRKEWDKVNETADLIMQLGRYSLLPNVEDLYAIGNSFNSEIIFSVKTTGDPYGKSLDVLAAGSTDIAQHQYDGKNDYWGFGTFRGELKVYYSYDPTDERFIKLFRHSFIDRKGKTVGPKTLNNKNNPAVNKSLPYIYSEKYPHPLAGTETDLRSDIYHASTLFVSRYAEVLLAKAEALNEISGPSGEVYVLINEVRNRANLPNLETTGSFDQSSLRDAIFQERQWEFFMEGYRRDDLIRQGTFVEKIENSSFTGDMINVQECHELFPIPEIEISLNNNLTQNDCY